MTAVSEATSIKADAEHRLAELVRQRARVANDARFDRELRSELEDIDSEILACKRTLGDYCTECGHRLLVVDGNEACCHSPCNRYGHPVGTAEDPNR